VKTLRPIRITRRGAHKPHPELAWAPCYWRFEFEANAFLHHMIRNIMGCLVVVGQGLQPPTWMAQVLAARSRDAAAPTFSPDGLYFLGPVYDAAWGLPSQTSPYDWIL
jgi:tRNA pseudouridine38-40 synthase